MKKLTNYFLFSLSLMLLFLFSGCSNLLEKTSESHSQTNQSSSAPLKDYSKASGDLLRTIGKILENLQKIDSKKKQIKIQKASMIKVRFLRFSGDSQSIHTDKSVEHGSKLPIIENPKIPTNAEADLVDESAPNAKLKAVFDGWYYTGENSVEAKWDFEKDKATKNLILYAKWKQTFKVNFYAEKIHTLTEANLLTISAEQIIPEGGKAKILPPQNPPTNAEAGFNGLPKGKDREQAYFAGWVNVEDGQIWNFAKNEVNQNLNLYPRWLPQITILATESQEYPTNPTPLTNEEAGFHNPNPDDPNAKNFKAYFDGWHKVDDHSKWKFDKLSLENLTLYGKWSPTKYQAKKGEANPELFNLKFDPNSLYALLYRRSGVRTKILAKEIDVSQVDNMYLLFSGKDKFNGEIGGWDVSEVESMNGIFFNAKKFNQSIGGWKVKKVKDMGSMFEGATAFNQPIGSWTFEKLTNTSSMFKAATSFDQPIENWKVQKIEDMESMFEGATSFNQSIGNWKVQEIENMESMFEGATSFNQSIGNWKISNVYNMDNIFKNATSFDQNLSSWILNCDIWSLDSMFDGSKIENTPNKQPILEINCDEDDENDDL